MLNIKNKIYINNLFILIVFLPVFFFAFYHTLIAKDRYVSTSSIYVQNIGNNTEISGVGALLAGIQSSSVYDLMVLKEYITSTDMMEELQNNYSILNHWNEQGLDLIYKLWFYKQRERAINYYQSKVKAEINLESGTLHISVESFSPEMSKKSLDFILKKSEEFVNNNAHKSALEQLRFIETKLKETKTDLDSTRDKVLNYQKKNKVLFPHIEIEQRNRKIAILQENKIKIETELNAKKTFLNENSPQIVTLNKSLEHIEQQLKIEQDKLNGNSKDKSINTMFDEFKLLEGELNLKLENYKNSLIFYERLKIESSRKLKQLIIVTSPKLPEYAIYPSTILNLIYTFIIFLITFGMISLLKGIIKSHK